MAALWMPCQEQIRELVSLERLTYQIEIKALEASGDLAAASKLKAEWSLRDIELRSIAAKFQRAAGLHLKSVDR